MAPERHDVDNRMVALELVTPAASSRLRTARQEGRFGYLGKAYCGAMGAGSWKSRQAVVWLLKLSFE